MSELNLSNREIADALVNVIGESSWEAVSIAYGYLTMQRGKEPKDAARILFERGPFTLKRSNEIINKIQKVDFAKLLTYREKIGSAENPVTKLFPATITEQKFLELLDEMLEKRKSITYTDDREVSHSLTDFTLHEGNYVLPINIKNAGTRFEKALELVNIEPNDCVPIPAYKANAAIESNLSLLYVVCVDYDLINTLNTLLPDIFNKQELIVWHLLNKYAGSKVRNGEDAFIFSMVRKYWTAINKKIKNNPFNVISARKVIKIMQNDPHRTPGIGLRAWGTGASAEVNVHVSIKNDMTTWVNIKNRIIQNGLSEIIEAVNRKRMAEVYDPEI